MKWIQYIGYQPRLDTRIYAFRVIDALVEAREFEFSIKTEALYNNKFKYQDIPDLCFAKLKHDLTFETDEKPLPPRFTVSDGELRRYVEEHYPAKSRPSRSW